jgi:hypothetical protein
LLDVLPLFAAQVWIPKAPEKISEMWFGLNYACLLDCGVGFSWFYGWILFDSLQDGVPALWCKFLFSLYVFKDQLQR